MTRHPKSILSSSLKVYNSNLDLEWIRDFLPIDENEKNSAEISVIPLN